MDIIANQIKALDKMNTKDLRAEWLRVFGKATLSKDPAGMRRAIAKQLRAAAIAQKAQAPKAPELAGHDYAAEAAAAEKAGNYSLAADLWTQAAHAATVKRTISQFLGFAAGARVRAEAQAPKGGDLEPAREVAPTPAVEQAKQPEPVRKAKDVKPFAHDPRVLAKYPIGSAIELKVADRVHLIKVVEGGFEYEGNTYRSPNTPVTLAKGGGKWNAYLVLGLDKPKARAQKGLDLAGAKLLVEQLSDALSALVRDGLPGEGWRPGGVEGWLNCGEHAVAVVHNDLGILKTATQRLRALLKYVQARQAANAQAAA